MCECRVTQVFADKPLLKQIYNGHSKLWKHLRGKEIVSRSMRWTDWFVFVLTYLECSSLHYEDSNLLKADLVAGGRIKRMTERPLMPCVWE